MIDISSDTQYPGGHLSNFYPHNFKFRGIYIGSMEGFLQGLKFSDCAEQEEIFDKVGYEAKSYGSKKEWGETLWWQGQPIKRTSLVYAQLLNEAYNCLYNQNGNFRKALICSGHHHLTHSIGHNNPIHTVLTSDEFCSILMNIRSTT